jgi:K+-transporting ATPase ATPase C chain
MTIFWSSLRMFIWMTLLTGILYPLLITGIANLTMKSNAQGSFVEVNGKVIGSKLIAQKFESDKYFWPRPSSIDYIPLPSGGSNLGPTSIALRKIVESRKAAISKSHQISGSNPIPSELLYASGSGLDPHISVSTAYFQIDRIIKSRGFPQDSGKKDLINLVDKLTEKRSFGFIGESYVNVLLLNKALDELTQTQKSK